MTSREKIRSALKNGSMAKLLTPSVHIPFFLRYDGLGWCIVGLTRAQRIPALENCSRCISLYVAHVLYNFRRHFYFTVQRLVAGRIGNAGFGDSGEGSPIHCSAQCLSLRRIL